MRASLLLAALASIGSGAAFICGTPDPSAEFRHISAMLAAKEALAANTTQLVRRDPIRIDTYFHVIQAPEGPEVTDQQLTDQFKVLTDTFAPYDISFDLKETTRTINPVWTDTGDELGMTTALRRGGYSTLNVYFMRTVPGATGRTYLPVPVAGTFSSNDGIQITQKSMPGGGGMSFNMGKTLTHEVGHWLGLIHTFDGGCAEPGDGIADTPAQASWTLYGCPIGRNSCPDMPGEDPIHNYMDYSSDECRTEFTPGQAERMRNIWYTLRAGK